MNQGLEAETTEQLSGSPGGGEEASPAIQLFDWSKSKYNNSSGQFNQQQQIDTIYQTHIAIPLQKPQADSAQPKKIAILYAANSDQSAGFIRGYASNIIPEFSGSGQAMLFAGLARKITRAKQQAQVHIIGLSTSKTGGENGPGNIVSLSEMDRDLGVVAWHIAHGWDVIGPGRPNGLNPMTEVSIGGRNGASRHWRSKDYVRIVRLSEHTVQYTKKNMQQGGPWTKEVKTAAGAYTIEDVNEADVPKADAENVLSQDQYMQHYLHILGTAAQQAWPADLAAAAADDQSSEPNTVFQWGTLLFWVGMGVLFLLGASGLLVEYGIAGMSAANEFNQMFLGVFDQILKMDIPVHEFRLAAIGFFSVLMIIALLIVLIRELILSSETPKAIEVPPEGEDVTEEVASIDTQQEQVQAAVVYGVQQGLPPVVGGAEQPTVDDLDLGLQTDLGPQVPETGVPLPLLNLDLDALLAGSGGNPTGADAAALSGPAPTATQPASPVVIPVDTIVTSDPAVTPTTGATLPVDPMQ